MNVFEKILEEIKKKMETAEKVIVKPPADKLDEIANDTAEAFLTAYQECEEIVRKYAEGDAKGSGWIQVSEKLPEPLTLVLVTVHTSEWIADYDGTWVPDEEKTYHPEEYNTRIAYKIPEGNWIFYDETGSEACCEEEIGSEKGVCYSVVTAWQPLPEPYKGV